MISRTIIESARTIKNATYYHAVGLNKTTEIICDVYGGAPVSTKLGAIISILKDHTIPYIIDSFSTSSPKLNEDAASYLFGPKNSTSIRK